MHKVLKLRKGWEFDRIFRTGIRANGELVRLLYVMDDSDSIKFGLAVGKKQGKAHVRVRGRRILREAFRHLSQNLTPGISLVLGLKAQGLVAKSQDIQRDLERLFSRKKLLQSHKCSPASQ
ncbi:MAG: ribonuclease P protein component [Synergistaceae bacterium]|nr:ribonuclease P protein component [Synergistaceae bacterium]